MVFCKFVVFILLKLEKQNPVPRLNVKSAVGNMKHFAQLLVCILTVTI